MASQEKSAPPASLDALFKTKAKKKPKATNMNAIVEKEKPPPPAPKAGKIPPAGEPGAAGEEGWERALRQDQDLLKTCGLWIKEVEADGACLFRAFADQLSPEGGDAHSAFREKCVDFMQAHRDDFEPFLEEDFAEYCRRMRSPTAWGGHVEVQAMARCEGVNALIYQPAEAGGRPQGVSGTAVEILTTDAEDARCVQLSFHPTHHHGQHYNSVRCVTDEGGGPAPVASLAELRRRIDDSLAPPPVATPVEVEPEETTPAAPVRAIDKIMAKRAQNAGYA